MRGISKHKVRKQTEVKREVQAIHSPLLHLHQEGLSVLADQVYPMVARTCVMC